MVVAASASSPDDVSKEARSILRSLKSFVANPTDARTVHESLARGFKALHRSLAGIQKGLSAAAEAAPRGRRKEAVVHGDRERGAGRTRRDQGGQSRTSTSSSRSRHTSPVKTTALDSDQRW